MVLAAGQKILGIDIGGTVGNDSTPSNLAAIRVLVVDDDHVACMLMVNYLHRIGLTDTTTCQDGDSAWHALLHGQFDLIVLDWKLPGLSGLALFNRIRSLPRYRIVPMLVVSGLLHRDDFRLLQEFPCTTLLEKPFTFSLFQNRVESLRTEGEWLAASSELIDAMIEACDHDGRKAEQVVKQMLKRAPNPLPLALLAAKRLAKAELLSSAQAILEQALKLDEFSVIVMNELGKVLHRRGRHEEAMNVLRAAQKVSTPNMQRLCLMGEIELNLTDAESARVYFETALAVDPEDKKAQAGLVVGNNMHELLGVPERMQVPHSFASLLNTMGISFIRSGDYARGIQQYEAALPFLTDQGDVGRIAFNLGLGFLRWGKAEDALPWFQRSMIEAPAANRSKAYVKALTASDEPELDEMPLAEKQLKRRWRRKAKGAHDDAPEVTISRPGQAAAEAQRAVEDAYRDLDKATQESQAKAEAAEDEHAKNDKLLADAAPEEVQIEAPYQQKKAA